MTFPSSAKNNSRSSNASSSLPSLRQVRAERCRRRLHEFVRHGWEVVEPETPLIWGWHIEAVCQHLEACTRQQLWTPGTPDPDGGRIQRLLINQPPGTMKSLLVSVFWPAWEWIEHPHIRSLFGSNALELAIRDSVRCRDLLQSDWYREWFDPQWALKGDQNVKSRYNTTAGGVRQCVSIGAQVTGFRGDKVVMDDPQDAKEAHSDTIRESANTAWDRGFSTRLNDPRKGVRVVVQQRLHDRDLTGHIIAKGGGYEHLCLPTSFDPENRSETSIGWRDPRTEFGELLFPQFHTPEVLEQFKKDLGSVDYAGQFEQRPSPVEGAIFRRQWWRFWRPGNVDLPPVRLQLADGTWHEVDAEPLPAEFDEEIQSWDCAFKDLKDSDFVCGQTWKRFGAATYLFDQVLARLSFTETVKAVREAKARHPNVGAILVEDKANGTAVLNTLQFEIPGLIAVEPDGGKVARAYATTPYVEAGNVYLPHPAVAPWVWDFIKSFTDFPNGAHDDEIDAMTQAVRRLLTGRREYVHAPTPDAPPPVAVYGGFNPFAP
jgi:predicted phage terminase large subunit-like protein